MKIAEWQNGSTQILHLSFSISHSPFLSGADFPFGRVRGGSYNSR